ncbi:MAG: hypothetical protein V1736_04470, partial [Pseudomonadota bacterium]
LAHFGTLPQSFDIRHSLFDIRYSKQPPDRLAAYEQKQGEEELTDYPPYSQYRMFNVQGQLS